MRKFLLAALVVMLAVETVHSLVWSLVLGNPVIDMKDESSNSGVDDVIDSSEDVSDIEHPRNTKLKTARNSSSLSIGSRPTRQHHGQVKQIQTNNQIIQLIIIS